MTIETRKKLSVDKSQELFFASGCIIENWYKRLIATLKWIKAFFTLGLSGHRSTANASEQVTKTVPLGINTVILFIDECKIKNKDNQRIPHLIETQLQLFAYGGGVICGEIKKSNITVYFVKDFIELKDNIQKCTVEELSTHLSIKKEEQATLETVENMEVKLMEEMNYGRDDNDDNVRIEKGGDESNWTQYLFPVCANSVNSLPNSGSVLSSTSSVKSNFKLKLDSQK